MSEFAISSSISPLITYLVIFYSFIILFYHLSV
nr:MAG TPA: hypothetical protein [Bacteriophage sp.]DAX88298.1 MAG TPA: hypothetical protein [Caudoviricetes sp.]